MKISCHPAPTPPTTTLHPSVKQNKVKEVQNWYVAPFGHGGMSKSFLFAYFYVIGLVVSN